MMLVSIPHKFKQPNIFSDRFKINFLLVIQKSGNYNYETDLVFYTKTQNAPFCVFKTPTGFVIPIHKSVATLL
jgi:hypothetical protein